MKRMKSIRILLLSFLPLFTGCSGEEEEALDFSPTREKVGSLVLENNEDHDIYYFLVESETARLILWVPTIDENTPTIASHSRVTVEYKDIYGVSETSGEVIFYWWKSLATSNNQAVVGEIQSRVIPL